MWNRLDSWRSPMLFWLVAIMMIAFFFSRAALSISMILFTPVALIHPRVKEQIANFVRSPLLWGISLLFIVPLISGLWSEDKSEWASILRIKLPLLVLPLAFAGYGISWRFSKQQWDWLSLLFIALTVGGVCWSLIQYAGDPVAINESYLRAKSIVTPLQNDRVRFSWIVSLGILMAARLAVKKRKENKIVSAVLAVVIVLSIVFLHILAVRTGLISLYIMMTGTAIWLAFRKMKPGYGIVLILCMLALPFIAYKTIPTFQNRIKYIAYDFGYVEKGNYWPSSNDARRRLSIEAGWRVMNDHPFTGVGAGDVMSATRIVYCFTDYILDEDKILPSSEWMIYGAAAGWPGFLLFTASMLIPFFVRSRNKWIWWMLNATAAFSFLFDIGLEVQFGVALYAFIILWCYHWLNEENISSLES